MTHLFGTTLTKNNRQASGHLDTAYVGLVLMPKRNDGSKAARLKRYGAYEVRLVEFSQGDPPADCLWLELYCHITQSSLDSCRCDNLDDAETVADDLVSRAKQLYDDSK
jgi:hypothetical protein